MQGSKEGRRNLLGILFIISFCFFLVYLFLFFGLPGLSGSTYTTYLLVRVGWIISTCTNRFVSAR
ncbi:hypothetical protein QBC44DRAFT_325328 [Cladorrhinum sp. PSN332]|nr:hypothetical protein QBC44DRAFT_325328 [Cladorrhinum sp. PSN332]